MPHLLPVNNILSTSTVRFQVISPLLFFFFILIQGSHFNLRKPILMSFLSNVLFHKHSDCFNPYKDLFNFF